MSTRFTLPLPLLPLTILRDAYRIDPLGVPLLTDTVARSRHRGAGKHEGPLDSISRVFGLIIISAIVGNILESKGLLTPERLGPRGIAAGMMVYFTLFCLLCFTIVPLAVRVFIAGQIKIGNGQLAIIKWLQSHEHGVVFAFWGFFIAGLVIIYAVAVTV